ncbi:MAG: hypothetical protein MIO90_06050 [Methanomassiliicoccales archaeon]|nr:hypothetical protein [Methanomassiliicoccales archaeon]
MLKIEPMRLWKDILGKIGPMSVWRKVALYAVIAIILYGSMIIVDQVFLVSAIDPGLTHPDLDVYRQRTQTILDGGLLYRDVPAPTQTPPIINYLLVPPMLFGGAELDWVWSIYFSFFAFLLATLIYLSLRHFDEMKAFLAGGVVLLSPYTLVESGTAEDESIVAFVFMLAVVLMVLERRNTASAVIGVGIWTKMFPILLAPIHILHQRCWKDRVSSLLVIGIITAIIVLPFVILCWDDFSFFLNFYFLGEDERPTGGHSIWHLLRMGGYVLPSFIQTAILGGALAFAYLYPYYRKLPIWQSVTVMLMAFFIFYPKIHGGYWIMLVAMLSVWAVQDRRIWARITFAFVPLLQATLLAEGEGSAPPFEFYGSWLVGFFCALIGLLLFVDAFRLAMKQPLVLSPGGICDQLA